MTRSFLRKVAGGVKTIFLFFRIPDVETTAMPDEADNTTVTPAGENITTPLAFLMVIKDVMIEGCLGELWATDG